MAFSPKVPRPRLLLFLASLFVASTAIDVSVEIYSWDTETCAWAGCPLHRNDGFDPRTAVPVERPGAAISSPPAQQADAAPAWYDDNGNPIAPLAPALTPEQQQAIASAHARMRAQEAARELQRRQRITQSHNQKLYLASWLLPLAALGLVYAVAVLAPAFWWPIHFKTPANAIVRVGRILHWSMCIAALAILGGPLGSVVWVPSEYSATGIPTSYTFVWDVIDSIGFFLRQGHLYEMLALAISTAVGGRSLRYILAGE